jgi:hypothetical protein
VGCSQTELVEAEEGKDLPVIVAEMRSRRSCGKQATPALVVQLGLLARKQSDWAVRLPS